MVFNWTCRDISTFLMDMPWHALWGGHLHGSSKGISYFDEVIGSTPTTWFICGLYQNLIILLSLYCITVLQDVWIKMNYYQSLDSSTTFEAANWVLSFFPYNKLKYSTRILFKALCPRLRLGGSPLPFKRWLVRLGKEPLEYNSSA